MTVRKRDTVGKEEGAESEARSVGALYACFLRAAELPGQWHDGGPAFLSARI